MFHSFVWKQTQNRLLFNQIFALFEPEYMKKIQRLVVALFVFSSVAFAQDKLLTLDDIFSPDPARRVRFSGTPTRPFAKFGMRRQAK